MSATSGSEIPPGPPQEAAASGGDAADRARAALERIGAPAALAGPLVAALGPGAAAELSADPWRLLAVGGVTPEQADYCARRALGDDASPDDPRRGRALAAHRLHRAAREGHTALEERRLASELRSAGVRSVDAALTAALDGGDAVLFEMFDEPDEPEDFDGDPGEMPDPDRWYAPARLGRGEQALGEGLNRLSSASEPIMDSATASETVEAVAERMGAAVDPRTAAALVTVALRGICVLTHGAGAGTAIAHTVACAAAVAADSDTGMALAAPTAQAAAELDEALAGLGVDPGVRAVPLAALLETRAPGVRDRGAGNPLDAGLVVVAGAMWLDVEHAAALVGACADGTHLVLLADPAQAPSAAPGSVVADLLASRTVHVAALPEDADAGPLARTAARVADGDPEEVGSPGREVVFVPADSASAAAHRAVQLITDSIPRALEIPPEQVQIVTAVRGGEAGADALNAACKERFNPGPGAYSGMDAGDRVLLVADGPGYAAGDVGYLRADAGGEGGGGATGGADAALAVELPGGELCPVGDSAHLRPGWAVTVAAAHGGRWPAVVAVFPPETRVSRPQVYTALTTARRHLSVVQAAGPALAQGVRDNAALERTTRLVQVLREG
ncbi:AAA family ATPase [Streptomonospora salina]|uniref:Exodeoxyribonuclease V alpha subunit n=1 Tax=Streptomonospora salina TaxID=104205 RepID=A0A841EK45_9ACTN|nr:helix-hairpin-helix domain-containing protein [Streptomonospora salina]MBB6001148.1 exodeoxyribonuclease V alpha subunit [Streptomonospora salina]